MESARCNKHSHYHPQCLDCLSKRLQESQVESFLRKPKQAVNYAKPAFTVEGVRHKFEAFADKTGIITPSSLKGVLISSGMDEKSADENVKGFFKVADVDRSGTITYKEYLDEYIRMQTYKFLRVVQQKFQDKDEADAMISKDEIVKALAEQLGDDEAKTQLMEVFKEMDADKSGQVSLKELVAWYYRRTAETEHRKAVSEDLNRELPIPISVLTDSYKATHFLMYPKAKFMSAYGEFRGPYEKDEKDSRFIFYGMRYFIENFMKPWTLEDVERADRFYATHNAGYTPFPFPKDLFLKFVKENKGYFPVKIEALPEGTVANVHVPVYQISATGEYTRLVTFLETLLTHVWYPTCVATLSRRTKDVIEAAFDKSVDPELSWLLESRLHDFGFRGTTCVEQSIIGGCAHLLNFGGSDTMSACYYAQYHLNKGKPVGSSIPATEHSVMTSWPTERQAIRNMINTFGGDGKIFACVMDSYDYTNALTNVLPTLKDAHTKKGGLMVLRPDSGDPVQCVLDALRAGEKTFGAVKNKKGFKCLNRVNTIQGDGINMDTVRTILDAALKEGYSAQNIAFGMGGGLLQKMNRDTMQFATKLNVIVFEDGKVREVMKKPKTDGGKISMPGYLKVKRVNGRLTVFPAIWDEKEDKDNELKVIYNNGPVNNAWDDFDTIKKRVATQWAACPKVFDPISDELKAKAKAWVKNFDENYAKEVAADTTA